MQPCGLTVAEVDNTLYVSSRSLEVRVHPTPAGACRPRRRSFYSALELVICQVASDSTCKCPARVRAMVMLSPRSIQWLLSLVLLMVRFG